jgi:hypothetical protein
LVHERRPGRCLETNRPAREDGPSASLSGRTRPRSGRGRRAARCRRARRCR